MRRPRQTVGDGSRPNRIGTPSLKDKNLPLEISFPTHELIDSKELSQTKAHTIINTARGGIVCESAILRSGINYIADVCIC